MTLVDVNSVMRGNFSKYFVIGVVFLITIVSFRAHLFPANSYLHPHLHPHPHCDSQKVLEGNSGAWKAPLALHGNHDSNQRAYSVNFTLGCPPQPFTAIIDTYGGVPAVPSSRCRDECPYGPKYDSSASWSYRRNGTDRIANIGILTYGTESIDVLTVAGGLQVSSQHFTELYAFDLYSDGLWRRSRMVSRSAPLTPRSDGGGYYLPIYFGLAAGNSSGQRMVKPDLPLPSSNAPDKFDGPFQTMIDEGVLDKNMFSLKLPQNERDEGHIMFGGYDHKIFEGDLVSHPLFPPHTKSWSVEASSISVTTTDSSGNPQALINESLAGYQAILSTRDATSYLPEPFFSQILAALNTKKGICQEYVVDCNNLDKLPVMSISIGGQNISLTGRDYTQRIRGAGFCKKPGLIECVPAIQLRWTPNPQLQPPVPPREDGEYYFVLGSTFLEKVYSVFDHDERTISFGTLKT